MKLKAKVKGKDVTFELQEMDALDFYDIQTSFMLGQVKFSQYAQAIIKECIASPVEAREIDYFRTCPKLLDKIVLQCSRVSKVGLTEEEQIEIIEE